MVFAQTPVSWHLNNMIPNRKQWKKWTLPSKLTAIGAYIGVIGLIITIIWLLIDNIKLKNESILITCESFIEDAPIEWNEGYGNDLPYQLTLTFPITIINNGIKPFTIVDYKLYPYNCAYVCACAFNYTFRGRDGDKGLYNLSNDTDPIIFPFSIKSGEGKTVFLKTAVVVYDCSRLFDSEEKITKENPSLFDLKVASTIWNRNNKNDGNYGESYDFFGNETSYAIGVRGLMGISLRRPDSLNQPVYLISFISSNGNTFTSTVSPYKFQSTFPFEECEKIYLYDRFDNTFQLKENEIDDYFQ